jgi:hypothetical protein
VIDATSLGAIAATIITALGARDLLKLYVQRHEGCGNTKCQKTMMEFKK